MDALSFEAFKCSKFGKASMSPPPNPTSPLLVCNLRSFLLRPLGLCGELEMSERLLAVSLHQPLKERYCRMTPSNTEFAKRFWQAGAWIDSFWIEMHSLSTKPSAQLTLLLVSCTTMTCMLIGHVQSMNLFNHACKLLHTTLAPC